jgi:acyl-CoA thioesterase-1
VSLVRRIARRALASMLVAAPLAAGAQPGDGGTGCPDPGPNAVLDGTLSRWPHALADRALRIVALGSSSTAGAGASAPADSYPARLEAALRARLPQARIDVVNAGRNGDDVGDMLARLDPDVLAQRPDLVVWQFGSNALLRGRDGASIERAAREGIDRLRGRGIDVVLMDLQHAPRIEGMPERDRMLGLIVRIGDTTRTPLFRRHRLMGAWRDALGDGYARMLSPDGLHMSGSGYACLADALAIALLRAGGPGGDGGPPPDAAAR